METLMDIGTFVIVGAIVSLLTQFLKNKWGAKEWPTIGIVVIISLIVAAFYTFFSGTSWWPMVIQTLVYAGAVYAYIILRFEK